MKTESLRTDEPLDAPPAGGPGLSRRRFLGKGLGAASLGGLAPLVVSRAVLGGAGQPPASETLRIAAVGIGGMGQHYLAGCKGERVVALCDVDQGNASKVFEAYPGAARYQDYRRMLDREAKNFDALIIGTPDHTHTVILLAAIALGKHVYCAKPVTHTIGEARRVRQALAAAPQLVTKTSVQSSGTEGARRTTELLHSGAIGPVRELHIWCDHPVYPCSVVRPKEGEPPPPGMDWDLWLGPAPYRPYHSMYHPWKWRPWWDFGSGTVGDMGCHTFHVYFDELELRAPTAVYGQGSFRCEGFSTRVETPECQSHANAVTWEFPARGDLPPLSLHWYDGGMKPPRPRELDHGIRMPSTGLLFVGERGKLMAGYSGGSFLSRRGLAGGLLLPEEKFRDFAQPAPTLRRVPDHYGEWTQACKTGARTVCPLELGCEMTELALLGALALRTGRLIEWDAQARRVTNDPEADGLVDPPYRAGWSG
ncbi:MAG: Gfo/Idh/MocA family oxidoreductase [Verrucomicrobia bacterium]|nr:Gfo/Idh/MocA family oxidoreductase [Verrucomicrobiota bacterium]